MQTREIKDKDGSIVVVITYNSNNTLDSVYRRRTDAMHYRGKEGTPSDQCEFFSIPKGMTDEYILTLVNIYEQGHAQGWKDGQWQLRWDFKNLMHIRQD